jgi:hypothetical protein
MTHDFCRRISNSYKFTNINGVLNYQPCCHIPPKGPINSKKDLELIQESFAKDINDNKEKLCNECLKRENFEFELSLRGKANRFIPKEANENDAYILEFQLDTKCNAACVICTPTLSSLWRKELDIIDTEKKLDYKDVLSLVNLTNLKQIKFVGGEPLLGSTHADILKEIPHPETVMVGYHTNGSIFPNNDVLDIWKKFKEVKVIVSVDGINECFEYIRWPLGWHKVEKNIIKMLDYRKYNIQSSIHCTINPLNAFYFDKLEEWAYRHNVPITISPCYGTWGIDVTPSELRDVLIKKYGTTHNITRMLLANKESKHKRSTLIENLNYLDKKRNISWKRVFHDIEKYI